MKRILFLFCMVLGLVSSVFADEATFNTSALETQTDQSIKSTEDQSKDVTLTFAKGTGTSNPKQVYRSTGAYRYLTMYSNNTLTIDAADGYAVTKVVFTTSGTGSISNLKYLDDDGTTTKSASSTTTFTTARASVTFTASSGLNLTKVVVTYETSSSVKKPTFYLPAGEYYGAQKVTLSHETAGAAIQYSTNGTDYTVYTAGTEIPVTESCTLYAKATVDGETSAVAKAAYTINPVYASLAELVAAGAPSVFGQKCQVTLTNEKIQNIGWNAAYTKRINVELKSGDYTVQLYKSGTYVDATWKKDGTLSGTMQGTFLLSGETWQFQPTNGFSDLKYADPVYPFTITDANGKTVTSKFTGLANNAANTLTVKYDGYTDGLTFKVNGTTKEYDTTAGLTITSTAFSSKNNVYTVSVYNGETLVAEQTITYIPVITSISSYKGLADGTEAILNTTSGKVTYVNGTSEVYLEDASKAIKCYNLFTTAPTAYRTISACNIWGIKQTMSNVAVIVKCDETATDGNCSITETETEVTPTGATLAKTLTAEYMQRYVILKGLLINKNGTVYTATSGSTEVRIVYNRTTIGTLTETSYADLTCLVTDNGAGTVQLTPTIAPEKVTDKITGTSGTVTWTIAADGSMVFAPTDGTSGTLAQTGTSTSKRPWASYVANVKKVSFEAGVNANATMDYLFKDMQNLESVDFTNFNTANMTSAKNMFNIYDYENKALKSVDLSGLDLSKVTSFEAFFNKCVALESVNFGDNTLAAATSFKNMFYSCKALKSLDFSKVTGEKVTNMASMLYDCTALESVDFSNFSTASISKADNAKNVFGTGDYAALPKTLKLSKNFGKTAVDGTVIALPAVNYIYTEDAEKTFDLTDAQGTGQADLYAYNAALADYGTYVAANAATTANLYVRNDVGCATFCAPFAVKVPEDVAAYTAAVQDNSWVKLTELEDPTTIPAGTPVILTGAQKGDVVKNFAGIATVKDGTVWGGDLVGNLASDADVYVPESDYVLQRNNNVTGWYVVESANSIKVGTNRCYMVKPAVAPGAAKAFYAMSFDGDATAINNVAEGAKSKKDGKYLVNGQIVVVKAGKAFTTSGAQIK